jgi:hypothetical protein
MGGYEEAASKGGMITSRGNAKPKKALKVKGYADGGAVEEDNSDDTTPIDDTLDSASTSDDPEGDDQDAYEESALPVSGGTTTASAKSKPQFSYQAAHDAAKAGVEYSQNHHQDANAPEEGAVTTDMSAASRGRSSGYRAHASGEGAVTRAEYETMRQQVNPNGKLSESEETMAIQAQLWEYTLKEKGPEAAERAAASVTQYQRMVSDRYKALAKVAAEHGDVTGTVKNTLRSYANIPTGDDLSITQTPDGKNIQAEFTDQQTGKRMQKIIMTPDQMLQWATKGGVQDFDSLLARSAGGRAELAARAARGDKDQAHSEKVENTAYTREQNAAKLKVQQDAVAEKARANDIKASADKTLKPSDEKTLLEQTEELTSALPKEQQPQGKDIGSIALTMRANNGGKGYADNFNATREITQVDPANPSARSFDFSVDQKTGKVTFDTKAGKFTVPADLAKRMSAMRAANMATAQAVLDKAKGSADRAASTGKAISNIAGQINAGNPQPMKGVPVLGQRGSLNVPTVPLDEAPPGSVPYRGLGER